MFDSSEGFDKLQDLLNKLKSAKGDMQEMLNELEKSANELIREKLSLVMGQDPDSFTDEQVKTMKEVLADTYQSGLSLGIQVGQEQETNDGSMNVKMSLN